MNSDYYLALFGRTKMNDMNATWVKYLRPNGGDRKPMKVSARGGR